MGALDLATQQLVLIARALSKRARLLILDEPTAALTGTRGRRGSSSGCGALKRAGVAIIFVSHRLAEVFAIADRIVVMRDGRILRRAPTAATSRDARSSTRWSATDGPDARERGDPAASAQPLRSRSSGSSFASSTSGGQRVVDGLDLARAQGEILGLVRPARRRLQRGGAGDLRRLARTPRAARSASTASAVQIDRPGDAVAHGIGLVAQDRRDGLMREHSIADNIVPRRACPRSRGWALSIVPAAAALGAGLASARRSRRPRSTPRSARSAAATSRRCRSRAGSPPELACPAPDRSDPRASTSARGRRSSRIWLRARGRAATPSLLVSSDAEELVELCDRVLVLVRGRHRCRAAEALSASMICSARRRPERGWLASLTVG